MTYALDKQGNATESNEYDFLPPTFLMPSEYVIFYEEFKKHQHNDKVLWIMKPVLVAPSRPPSAREEASSSSTASQKSTDGRDPIRKYQYRTTSASATSSTPSSSEDASSICASTHWSPPTTPSPSTSTATVSHASPTTDTITSTPKTYVGIKASRQTPHKCRNQHECTHLRQTYRREVVPRQPQKFHALQVPTETFRFGIERTNEYFSDIQRCIIKSLKAVQKLVSNSTHCFELYGYDFLFDGDGKAWLLEVNGGPSMTANTPEDSKLKIGLIDDVMTVINVEGV